MPPKNIYRSRKVVSCKYCFYEKNDECQLRVCPYVAERITAKVINYEKLILEFFKGNQPRLFSTRLRKHCRTYRHFSYLSTSHRKLFEQTRDEIARITYTPVCGADLAILYLSTSDELMSKHIIPLITHAKQLSWRFESNGSLNAKKYAIFKTAKQFTKGDFEINPQEFLSSEFVPDSTFSLIINALLLANYSFFTMGGARSHDIEDGILNPTAPDFEEQYWALRRMGGRFRVNHCSWWKQELPCVSEYEEAKRNLDRVDYKVDYIVTHCAPNNIVDKLGEGGYIYDPLTDFLENVREKASFHYWLFGHYHNNKIIDDRFVLLWEQMVQVL